MCRGKNIESAAVVQPDELLVRNEARENQFLGRDSELLTHGATKQAFQVWTAGADAASAKPAIFDGGFEGTLSLDESGFGWRLAPVHPGIEFSIDGNQPQSGNRSLRITFSGNTNPALELVSQLVVIDPAEHYRMHFSIRTEKLVTGGPLVMFVLDNGNQQVLARSQAFPADTGGWQTISTDIVPAANTSALKIVLKREECSTSPCPVFGTVSLDSFSLEPIKTAPAK